MPQYRNRIGSTESQNVARGKRAEICRALPSSPGIYLIRFRNGEAAYVGSSVNISSRIKAHLWEIRNGKFMDSPGRYEPEEIEVLVLELVDDLTTLEEREIACISEARNRYKLVNKIKPGRWVR